MATMPNLFTKEQQRLQEPFTVPYTLAEMGTLCLRTLLGHGARGL